MSDREHAMARTAMLRLRSCCVEVTSYRKRKGFACSRVRPRLGVRPATRRGVVKRRLPVILDCVVGRRLGCATFCCRLIVRLGPGETDPCGIRRPLQGCVDKSPDDGLCVYLDRDTGLCSVWERRPGVCRGYDCNRDPLLQVVLQHGFSSLAELVRDVGCVGNRLESPVPYLGSGEGGAGFP